MAYQDYIEKTKNERMDTVVSHAAALFLKKGVENVKMTDIARDCDIGVASLYRYFKTKSSILIETGIFQWRKVKSLFDGVFDSDYYAKKDGASKIEELLKIQLILFSAHKDFIRFLYEFDAYMIKEKVPKSELAEYEKSILNIAPLYQSAYNEGIRDNTIRSDLDFNMVYKSISHAMMSVSQRFILGEILPSDDYNEAEAEIRMIIDMVIYYISNKNVKGGTYK